VPTESTPDEIHASFRPTLNEGMIILSMRQSGSMRVVDALQYGELGADQSYGVVLGPSENRQAQLLSQPTPGQANASSAPPAAVRINEWMASSTRTLLNPTSGHYEDWFELYNASSQPIDLTGYSLTDDLDKPRQWVIPAGTQIDAKGFLLVWADGGANSQTTALHANFKLNQSGEALGLFAPNGALVDSIVFGPQQADVSQGRWPDGSIAAPRVLSRPTPGAPNEGDENPAPLVVHVARVRPDSQDGFTLTWTAEPGKQYQLQYKNALLDAEWQNLGNPVTAREAIAFAVDPNPSLGDQRFYRIVQFE
jgi:hypothetical protein